MDSLAVFYLCATVSPLILNLVTRQRADAVGLAGMLVLTYAFGRVMRVWLTPPEALQFYPLEDALCAIITFAAWRTQREWWKVALCGLFLFQLCAHAAFWASWGVNPTDKVALRTYMVLLNATYILQLLTVSTGGIRRVAILAISLFPLRGRFVRHSGA